MIPLHLRLSGFLSYRDPAEVDFTRFHLACISGGNGAGKSSLLDAITWALFGQARKRDESIVNLASDLAEVAFCFSYEGNIYRVQRALPRGKTGILEFQVASQGDPGISLLEQEVTWRPLTAHAIRETQKRIEETLRLDYETFVNVSFFLQGRADLFAQQPAARRKEILGSILGLEQWELYKERALERRRSVERDLVSIEDRLQEIADELGEEAGRRENLSRLESELALLSGQYDSQKAAVQALRERRLALQAQAELVGKLSQGLERLRGNAGGLTTRLEGRQKERDNFTAVLEREEQIRTAYEKWQTARTALEKWEGIASRFREQEKQRQPFLEAINKAQAKLEGEREALEKQQVVVDNLAPEQATLEKDLPALRRQMEHAEAKSGLRPALEAELAACREQNASLQAENRGLKEEMNELDSRLAELAAAEGATCPLCGQSLSPEHRQSTLESLQAEGKGKGDTFRKNVLQLKELAERIPKLEAELNGVDAAGKEHLRLSVETTAKAGRLEAIREQTSAWKDGGAKRLPEVQKLLQEDGYAHEARQSLAQLDQELASLGYEPAAHEAARKSERENRQAEAEFRTLESTRTALAPLDDELGNLQEQIKELRQEISRQEQEHAAALADLAAQEASAPDLASAEAALHSLEEQRNLKHQEVGAAQQKVEVLKTLKGRQVQLTGERESTARLIGCYKVLERAFGRDGVPALLIEQALPEIETRANELLDRLSNGSMSVRFLTQSAYKDKKRADLKETLEIQLSDGVGVRDYEMYSGGEAFRANFAIRLALSQVLASRKGARLQMLVIDEGFGSQDEQGRQRLIQAIRLVQEDFAKVLVITHLDELKDAFPSRIEVEKDERGSRVSVV